MPVTPDRFPGTRYEEEIQMEENTTPSGSAGSFSYDGTSFSFVDSLGAFDPRSGSGGITEPVHRDLDTITHELDETSYDEVTYVGFTQRISNITTWDSPSKNVKIREYQLTYSGRNLVQAVMIQYDASGNIHEQITEQYTYTGRRITSVTRTRDV